MIGNDLYNESSNDAAKRSLLAQCNNVALSDSQNNIDTQHVSLVDKETCNLVGGVQRVVRALQIT